MSYDEGYDEGYRAGMQKMREVGQTRIDELEAKREWVGLTDRDLQIIWSEAQVHSRRSTGEATYAELARAIEAKLKEKNT